MKELHNVALSPSWQTLTPLKAGAAGGPLDIQGDHRQVRLRGVVLRLQVRRVLHHLLYLLDNLHGAQAHIIRTQWTSVTESL